MLVAERLHNLSLIGDAGQEEGRGLGREQKTKVSLSVIGQTTLPLEWTDEASDLTSSYGSKVLAHAFTPETEAKAITL